MLENSLPALSEEGFSLLQRKRPTSHRLRYRRETRSPLQTSAFRLIPKRLRTDNDENLAVSVARRSQLLIDIANEVWPLLLDVHLPSAQKFEAISSSLVG
jgi:hypothetical protein